MNKPLNKQGSDAWHQWRGKGIGSSDAPVIMGESPWLTPYQLWERKLGLAPEQEDDLAMQRGRELEPIARSHYELLHNIEMPPTCVESAEFPFMRASLDGYNQELGIVLEIKCPGAEDHAAAASGGIPKKYFWQLQHQLMVTGAKCAHYYSFNGTAGHLVSIGPNDAAIADLIVNEIKFWACIQSKTPPPLADRDYKNVMSKELSSLLDQYQVIKNRIKVFEEDVALLRTQILAHCEDHPRIRCGDYKIQRLERKGAVDYNRIPELKEMDLDQYRKKPVVYYDIRGKNETEKT